MTDDEIFEYNLDISSLIDLLTVYQQDFPDARDLKDEDKNKALSYLFDINENLTEAVDNIYYLKYGFDYD